MREKFMVFLVAIVIAMGFINNSIYASTDILGTYTTRFGVWDEPRTNNIKLATKSIDYKIVKSGETFSFNQTVGDRTIEKGYQESTVFVYDQKAKGVGGGVCQVSTTLYNAALYSDMEIVERHTHKREIYYAPNDRDATVDYKTLDFKFKNNYSFDVQIRAYTYEDKLTVEILKI